MKQQVKERDAAIASLRAKVDDLEQYTSRNSVRIMGIRETSNEDTDKITIAIAKKIDIDQIDRSHRVSLKKDGGARPIIREVHIIPCHGRTHIEQKEASHSQC